MASKSVATVEPSVGTVAPVLAPMAGFEAVDMSDVQLPRIYLQAPLSNAVRDGVAKPGNVTLSAGSDDPAPTFLIDDDSDSFIGYIIGREKFAATTSGGGLTFHPDKKRDPNDSDSWEGWFFDIALPDHDPMVPARWMLWKTSGAPVARAINTLLERKFASGDPSPLCIKVTVGEKTSPRGHKYHVFKVAPVAGSPDDQEIVARLRATAQDLRARRGEENVAPTVEQPSFS